MTTKKSLGEKLAVGLFWEELVVLYSYSKRVYLSKIMLDWLIGHSLKFFER